MTRFVTTIQEGHVAGELRETLTQGLQAAAARTLGDHPSDAEVKWKVMRRGFAWTAGHPSNSSVVFCLVPDELDYEIRVRLMEEVNDLWVRTTGADANELLVFTTSQGLPPQQTKGQ